MDTTIKIEDFIKKYQKRSVSFKIGLDSSNESAISFSKENIAPTLDSIILAKSFIDDFSRLDDKKKKENRTFAEWNILVCY